MKSGDTVLYRTLGETWTVAVVDGDLLMPAGWPSCAAPISECDLVEECSIEESHAFLEEVACLDDRRGQLARQALVGIKSATHTTATPPGWLTLAVLILAALSLTACPVRLPCAYTPGCPAPTPTPAEDPRPTPTPMPQATPTPVPTSTASPTPTAAPGKPDVCPCMVIWATTLHSCTGPDHLPVAEPAADGWCVVDSTLAFERTPGDARGGPCDTPDRIATTCGGRNCEPLRGPDWSVTSPAGVPQHEDGFQLRLGPLKRGSYTVQVLFPSNLHDQEDPARALRRCPQVPGPTRSDTVSFEVE